MMLAASFVSSKSPRFVSASYVFVMGLVLYGDAEQVRTKELKPRSHCLLMDMSTMMASVAPRDVFMGSSPNFQAV